METTEATQNEPRSHQTTTRKPIRQPLHLPNRTQLDQSKTRKQQLTLKKKTIQPPTDGKKRWGGEGKNGKEEHAE
jgi:hypothetical protein